MESITNKRLWRKDKPGMRKFSSSKDSRGYFSQELQESKEGKSGYRLPARVVSKSKYKITVQKAEVRRREEKSASAVAVQQ